MNETSAKEWFVKAWHNLSTAKILYDVDHYTDIIAFIRQLPPREEIKEVFRFCRKTFW